MQTPFDDEPLETIDIEAIPDSDDPVLDEHDPDPDAERQALSGRPSASEGLDDLEAYLAVEMSKRDHAKSLARKYVRYKQIAKSQHPDHLGEKAELISSIRKLEDEIVWRTVGAVALVHTQVCLACGAEHAWFEGWMTDQTHRSDPNARRMIAGKPIETLPERVERHKMPAVDACAFCVESQIIIGEAARAAK